MKILALGLLLGVAACVVGNYIYKRATEQVTVYGMQVYSPDGQPGFCIYSEPDQETCDYLIIITN